MLDKGSSDAAAAGGLAGGLAGAGEVATGCVVSGGGDSGAGGELQQQK